MVLNKLEIKPEDKAAIYARKSILSDNHSIDSQIALGKDVLFKKNLILYEVYRDEISAREAHFTERPAFTKLLKDAEAGLFKSVIVFRRDRLARRFTEFKQIQTLFARYGINVIYSNEGEYQANNSGTSDFIENLIVAMDELEVDIINQRTRAGIEKKRERGEYSSRGKIPFGFRLGNVQDEFEYMVNENEANVIKAIFDGYKRVGTPLGGWDYKLDDLAREISLVMENNLPIVVDKKVEQGSSGKIKGNINSYIKNPIYGGYIFKKSKDKLSDVIVKNEETGEYELDEDKLVKCKNVQSILDEGVWKEAVIRWRQIYRERSAPIHDYLFKGLLQCSKCGKSITRVYNKKTNTSKLRCKKGCTNINEESLLEILIIRVVKDLINVNNVSEHIKEKVMNEEQGLKKVNGMIDELKLQQVKIIIEMAKSNSYKDKKTIEKLKCLIEKEEKKYEERKDYENRLYSLIDSMNRAKSAAENLENSVNQKLLLDYFRANIEEGQKLLKNIIKKVIFNANKCEFNIKSIDYGKENESYRVRKSIIGKAE